MLIRSQRQLKKWAEDITKAYDSYPTGKQLRGLAAYLGTDVKTAMKQLQVAQGVMYNEYENEADMYDDLKDIAEVVQTTCKVELFVAGFPANGVTTLTEAGVTLLNGVDTLVAVSNTGADIILGENHNVTVYTNLLKDGLSPITSITGLLTFDSSFTSNADRISYIGDSLNSLIFEGKLFGGIIDLNEEDNTYIGKTYETIGAVDDAGPFVAGHGPQLYCRSGQAMGRGDAVYGFCRPDHGGTGQLYAQGQAELHCGCQGALGTERRGELEPHQSAGGVHLYHRRGHHRDHGFPQMAVAGFNGGASVYRYSHRIFLCVLQKTPIMKYFF